jgi:hypothetical protein
MPKSKFAYKSKEKMANDSDLVSEVRADTPSSASMFTTPDALPSTHLALSSQSNCHLTLESLPKTLFSTREADLTISDLNGCIVNLLPRYTGQNVSLNGSGTLDISALHVRNLKNTLLLLPEIKGSILLHFLTRCVVVVGCHQVILHLVNAGSH